MRRRKVEIKMKHATYEQIQKLYRETNDADLKIRYLAMLKFMDGYTSLKVAELLNTSDSTVRDWLNRYNASGIEGLIRQKPKKQCRDADPEKQEAFKEELKELVENADDDTVILYEDEAIIADEPTTTCKWTPVGKQPVVQANSKGSLKHMVIFGACNPKTEEVIYSTKEAGNSESFENFIK